MTARRVGGSGRTERATAQDGEGRWRHAKDIRPLGAVSRRQFLGASVTAAAAAFGLSQWGPVLEVPAASAQSTLPVPPLFPTDIDLYQQAFENWSEEIVLDDVWTCAPRSADDAVTLANWAATFGYQLRARGKMHSWSPLTVPSGGSGAANLVLVDTTKYLTACSIDVERAPARVTAQPGITMDELLAALETAGLGLTAHPAPGDVTLGGVLAIDGHGAAVPADGEQRSNGHTYGSISNLVLALTAVVWDLSQKAYALREFSRDDPAIQPLLTNLGRTFITDVTLQVGANSRMRCQSTTEIPVSDLFGPPGSSPYAFDRFIAESGRAEAIWYPFTTTPWFKVWSLAPERPSASREVQQPYNYVFADVIPASVSNLARDIVEGDHNLTPQFGSVELLASREGLAATDTADIWGWAKDVLLYVKPTTLRFTANGYAVITSRSNIQQAIHDFATFYQGLLTQYQHRGQYPINGAVELRACGLDVTSDVDVPGALSPQLSALRPRPDHPEWDTAVWFDVLTMPGTPLADEFYRELEQWFVAHFTGWATVRVEWSKGWAYSSTGAWSDSAMLTEVIPDSLRAGQSPGDNWDSALATLDDYDPKAVFTNSFLRGLIS
jgi:FAD/FMN-containing dehydrogenase